MARPIIRIVQILKGDEHLGNTHLRVDGLPLPLAYAALALAYLDSATTLCNVLKRRRYPRTDPRGNVILFLTAHSVELFLKAAIIQQSPDEKKAMGTHDLEQLYKRYSKLYPKKAYRFPIPFSEISMGDDSDLRKTSPSESYRYLTNRDGRDLYGISVLEPNSFSATLKEVRADLERLTPLVFGEKRIGLKGQYSEKYRAEIRPLKKET